MSRVERYTTQEAFLKALEAHVAQDRSRVLEALTPVPVPEAEALLDAKVSKLRYFAFLGASGGFVTGLAFTSYTVLSWPLVIGGKPLISVPPFLIIAYTLTILFGSLATFFGFLWLSALPRVPAMLSKESVEEEEGEFLILLKEETS